MDFESTPEFEEQFSKLTRKNKALEERFLKKISQIIDHDDFVYPRAAEILERIERES
jgi:hypothetical protein